MVLLGLDDATDEQKADAWKAGREDKEFAKTMPPGYPWPLADIDPDELANRKRKLALKGAKQIKADSFGAHLSATKPVRDARSSRVDAVINVARGEPTIVNPMIREDQAAKMLLNTDGKQGMTSSTGERTRGATAVVASATTVKNSGEELAMARSQKKWQGIDDVAMERHERAMRVGGRLLHRGMYDLEQMKYVDASAPKDYMDPKIRKTMEAGQAASRAEEEKKKREREWAGGKRAGMGAGGRAAGRRTTAAVPPSRMTNVFGAPEQPVGVIKPKSKIKRAPILKQTAESLTLYRENPNRKQAVLFDNGFDAEERTILRVTQNIPDAVKEQLSANNIVMRSAKIVADIKEEERLQELANRATSASGSGSGSSGSGSSSGGGGSSFESSEETSMDSEGGFATTGFLAVDFSTTDLRGEDNEDPNYPKSFFPYFKYEKNGHVGTLMEQSGQIKQRGFGKASDCWSFKFEANRFMVPRLEFTALNFLQRKIETLDAKKRKGDDQVLDAISVWDKEVSYRRAAYLKQQRRIAEVRIQEFLVKGQTEDREEAEVFMDELKKKGRDKAVANRVKKKNEEDARRMIQEAQIRRTKLEVERKEIDPTVQTARRSSRIGMDGLKEMKVNMGFNDFTPTSKVAMRIAAHQAEAGGAERVALLAGDSELHPISRPLPLRGSITPSRAGSDDEAQPWRLAEEVRMNNPGLTMSRGEKARRATASSTSSKSKTLSVPGMGSTGQSFRPNSGGGVTTLTIAVPGADGNMVAVHDMSSPNKGPNMAPAQGDLGYGPGGEWHRQKPAPHLPAVVHQIEMAGKMAGGSNKLALPAMPTNQNMKGFDMGHIVLAGAAGAPPASGRGSRRASFIIEGQGVDGSSRGGDIAGYWVAGSGATPQHAITNSSMNPSSMNSTGMGGAPVGGMQGGGGEGGDGGAFYGNNRARGELTRLSGKSNPAPHRRPSLEKAIHRGEKRRNSLSSILSAEEEDPVRVPKLTTEMMMTPTQSDVLLNAVCGHIVNDMEGYRVGQLASNPSNYFCPTKPSASSIPGEVLRQAPGNIFNGGRWSLNPSDKTPKIVFSERQYNKNADTIDRMIDEFHKKNPDAAGALSQFHGVESLLKVYIGSTLEMHSNRDKATTALVGGKGPKRGANERPTSPLSLSGTMDLDVDSDRDDDEIERMMWDKNKRPGAERPGTADTYNTISSGGTIPWSDGKGSTFTDDSQERLNAISLSAKRQSASANVTEMELLMLHKDMDKATKRYNKRIEVAGISTYRTDKKQRLEAYLTLGMADGIDRKVRPNANEKPHEIMKMLPEKKPGEIVPYSDEDMAKRISNTVERQQKKLDYLRSGAERVQRYEEKLATNYGVFKGGKFKAVFESKRIMGNSPKAIGNGGGGSPQKALGNGGGGPSLDMDASGMGSPASAGGPSSPGGGGSPFGRSMGTSGRTSSKGTESSPKGKSPKANILDSSSENGDEDDNMDQSGNVDQGGHEDQNAGMKKKDDEENGGRPRSAGATGRFMDDTPLARLAAALMHGERGEFDDHEWRNIKMERPIEWEKGESMLDRALERQKSLRPVCIPVMPPFNPGFGKEELAKAIRNSETLAVEMEDMELYAEMCQLTQVKPNLSMIQEQLRTRFNAIGQDLTDNDLLALSVLIQKRPIVYLDLSGNCCITDRSFIELMQKVTAKQSPAQQCMKCMRLQSMTGLDDQGIGVLVRALERFSNLQELNLNHMHQLAPSTLLDLAQCLGEKAMMIVSMVDTRIPIELATEVLELILDNPTLKRLDFGWNTMNADTFDALRDKVADHPGLRYLSVPNCSMAALDRDEFHPMNYFLEGVRDYDCLRYLDLSMNFLNEKSAVILEAALYDNAHMLELFMDDNPIGQAGCRSLLRALADPETDLEHIGLSSMYTKGPKMRGKGGVLAAGGTKYAQLGVPTQATMANPALTKSEAAGQGNPEYRGGISHAEEAAIPKLPGREVIDPATCGKMGINYSLYSFLFTGPQRIYRLNLMDPGERALMYLLLKIRDLILGEKLTPMSTTKTAAGANVRMEGLSEETKNDVFVPNMEKSRWEIVVPDYEDFNIKSFNPLIEFAFKVNLPLWTKEDSRPSSPKEVVKKQVASSALGFRKSVSVQSLSSLNLGLDGEKLNSKKSMAGSKLGVMKDLAKAATGMNKGPSVAAAATMLPGTKSGVGRYVDKKAAEKDDVGGITRREAFLLSEDASVIMLRKYRETYAVPIDFKTRVRMVCLWKSLGKSQGDREVMLSALALDFAVPYQMIGALIRIPNSLPKHQILSQLFPAMQGGIIAQRMCFVLDAETPEDRLKMRLYSTKLLSFRPGNPTGSYMLNLEAPDEFVIADSIMKIDQWERQLMAKTPRRYGKSKYMISQHGNDSNFRNETINGWFFEMGSSFQLPTSGTMQFDYVSSRRPPRNAMPVSDNQVGRLMRAMIASNSVIPDLKQAFMAIAPQMYLTCLQLRKLLQLVQNFPDLMLDAVCIFVNRTVDWFVNEKIVRATVFRREWELRLKPRLGACLLFPYVQPENWAFSFDFRFWEDRICLSHLFGYLGREKGEVRDTGWDYDYDGQPDELTMGIPRIWETSWPNLGILTGTYSCSPSDTDMEFRMKNCNTYGLWEAAEEDECCIRWWMTIEETPMEMLELSLLLLHEFHTLADAYWFLDFYHTDNVTLQNWRERLGRLGARNQSKLDNCFRFLNRNNDGSIGWIEFKVVNDLWQEIFLGVEEFFFFIALKASCVDVCNKAGWGVDPKDAPHSGMTPKEKKMLNKRLNLRPKNNMIQALKTKLAGAYAGGGGPVDHAAVKEELEAEMADIMEIEDHDRKMEKKSKKKQSKESFKEAVGMGTAKKPGEDFQWKQPVGQVFEDDFEFVGLDGCWDMMDASGDGNISQEEFAEFVKKYQYHRQNDDIIYFVLDADGDEISRDEFILGLKALRRKHKAAEGDPNRKEEKAPAPSAKVKRKLRAMEKGEEPEEDEDAKRDREELARKEAELREKLKNKFKVKERETTAERAEELAQEYTGKMKGFLTKKREEREAKGLPALAGILAKEREIEEKTGVKMGRGVQMGGTEVKEIGGDDGLSMEQLLARQQMAQDAMPAEVEVTAGAAKWGSLQKMKDSGKFKSDEPSPGSRGAKLPDAGQKTVTGFLGAMNAQVTEDQAEDLIIETKLNKRASGGSVYGSAGGSRASGRASQMGGGRGEISIGGMAKLMFEHEDTDSDFEFTDDDEDEEFDGGAYPFDEGLDALAALKKSGAGAAPKAGPGGRRSVIAK